MTIQDFFSQSIAGDLYNDLKRFWDLSETTVESNKKSNQMKIQENERVAREQGIEPVKLTKKELLTTDPVRIFTDFLKKVKGNKVDVGGIDSLTSHPEHNILLKALESIKTKSKSTPSEQFDNIYRSSLVEAGKTMTLNPFLFKTESMSALDKQKCINNIKSTIDKAIKFALQKFKFKSGVENEIMEQVDQLIQPDPPNSPIQSIESEKKSDIKHYVENPNEIPEMTPSTVSPIPSDNEENKAAPSFGDLQNLNPQALEKELEQKGVDTVTQKVKGMFLNKFN
jgi:hypothetical protein